MTQSETLSGLGSQWYSEMYWWTQAEASATRAAGHTIEQCSGNCRQHPLITKELLPILRAHSAGWQWGNFVWEEEEAERARESPAVRAKREQAEAVAAAAEDAKRKVLSQAFKIQTVQECQAIRYAKKGKIAEPCKKLYSCCGGGADGGVARPTTMHVSSECWRHEYTDPRNGEKKAPHSCNWLHPGEDGWRVEWQTDRTWKAPVAANRFADAVAEAAETDGFQPAQKRQQQSRNNTQKRNRP